MITAVDVVNTMARQLAEQNAGAGGTAAMVDLCTDDVVFEFPFAPAGRPTRVEGKPALADYLKGVAGRASVEGVSSLEVHETVKPEVAIIEMTLTGTVTATGAPYARSYISVLTVRDGLIAHYRDYWNPLESAA